jgi:CRP-like cAMP-binding protein
MVRADLPTLTPLLRKLQRWQPLDQEEQDAVLRLPHTVQELGSGAHLVREGRPADQCCLLLSGFACRYKVAGSGARAIHAIHMAGDFVDLQNALLEEADHSV